MITALQLEIMQKTLETIENVFQSISQEVATTYRDGPDGWTTLEVLCHLRDYDAIYRQHAEMMATQENPTLSGSNHETMAIERAYNQQELRQVLAEFKTSRQESLAVYRELTPDDWERPGQHVAFGAWSVGNMIAFVGWHDNNHIEQITRILIQANGENEDRSNRNDYK